MATGFMFLGGVLIGFSLLVLIFVLARTWPSFEPAEPDQQVRLTHYLQSLRAEWRVRPAWKAIRYAGFTGVVWVLAGLIIGQLPAAVLAMPFFSSLIMPLLTYGPVLVLFFYDQLHGKKQK